MDSKMATLQELIAQQVELDKKIAEMRERELADAVGRARALIDQYGLTSEDIFGGKSGSKRAGKAPGKVAARYRNPATGTTWTGRGRAPRWLDGKDKNDFLIT